MNFLRYICEKYNEENSMYSFSEISKELNKYIDTLDLSGEPQSLYEPIKYALEAGGKRLRPMLTILACNIFSENPYSALPAAAAIEVFHNFTLLHDDIMDNAAVRRGKPSVFNKWGQNSAILSGDAMVICAYKLLYQTPTEYLASVLSCFNYMALAVCEGQQFDMEFESRDDVTLDEYITMIDKKTAALVVGATLIGAITGGAEKHNCQKLLTFATEFGLAFQIQDDLLDAYGTEEQLGKRIGGDIVENKKTFLTITALQMADRTKKREILELLSDKEMGRAEKISRMIAIYDELGVKEHTEREINIRFDKALAALDSIDVAAERLEPMKEIARSLLNRKR